MPARHNCQAGTCDAGTCAMALVPWKRWASSIATKVRSRLVTSDASLLARVKRRALIPLRPPRPPRYVGLTARGGRGSSRPSGIKPAGRCCRFWRPVLSELIFPAANFGQARASAARMTRDNYSVLAAHFGKRGQFWRVAQIRVGVSLDRVKIRRVNIWFASILYGARLGPLTYFYLEILAHSL